MDDNEDNIREPDKVKMDKLLDYDFDYDYDYGYGYNSINYTPLHETKNNDEINLAIELSKQEFKLLQKEKQQKFKNSKIQLQKLILFDKSNLYYYELILSVIEMYENGIISEYKSYDTEYKNIFNILRSIRLPADEIENITKIIVCN